MDKYRSHYKTLLKKEGLFNLEEIERMVSNIPLTEKERIRLTDKYTGLDTYRKPTILDFPYMFKNKFGFKDYYEEGIKTKALRLYEENYVLQSGNHPFSSGETSEFDEVVKAQKIMNIFLREFKPLEAKVEDDSRVLVISFGDNDFRSAFEETLYVLRPLFPPNGFLSKLDKEEFYKSFVSMFKSLYKIKRIEEPSEWVENMLKRSNFYFNEEEAKKEEEDDIYRIATEFDFTKLFAHEFYPNGHYEERFWNNSEYVVVDLRLRRWLFI